MNDYILDRIRLKSKIAFWRNAAIAVAAIAALYFFVNPENNPTTSLRDKYIARISINDEINEDFKREQTLAKLANNDKVQAVILHLDTPGGTAYGGESLYHSIHKIAKKKPVVAVIGTAATSAGYMVALAADTIYARNTSLTGSVGAIILTGEISELAKKLGVNFITIQSGDLKAEPLFTHPLTEKTKVASMKMVTNISDFFTGLVVKHRKLSPAQVAKIADGRVFTGQQALENKLIDAIGSEEEAIDWLVTTKKLDKTTPIKDVELKDKDELLKRLSLPLNKISQSIDIIYNVIKSFQTSIVAK